MKKISIYRLVLLVFTFSLLSLSSTVQAQFERPLAEILATTDGITLSKGLTVKASPIVVGAGKQGASSGQLISGANKIQGFAYNGVATLLTPDNNASINNGPTAAHTYTNAIGYELRFSAPTFINNLLIVNLDGNHTPTQKANAEWISVYGVNEAGHMVPLNATLGSLISTVNSQSEHISGWPSLNETDRPQIYESSPAITGIGNSNSDPNQTSNQIIFNSGTTPADAITKLFIIWGSYTPETAKAPRAIGLGTANYILPLQLVHFSGKIEKDYTLLSWKTKDEVNTADFEILSSNNGKDFSTVGNVKAVGSGDNNYSFKITTTENGNNYYKLKMIDSDEKNTFSPIILINNQLSKNLDFSIFPNPVVNTLNIHTSCKEAITISIYNVQGKEVIKEQKSPGSNYSINCSGLSAGTHYIKIIGSAGKSSVKQFLKQ